MQQVCLRDAERLARRGETAGRQQQAAERARVRARPGPVAMSHGAEENGNLSDDENSADIAGLAEQVRPHDNDHDNIATMTATSAGPRARRGREITIPRGRAGPRAGLAGACLAGPASHARG